MARIFDENFKEQGYSEVWIETVGAGCSINENMAVNSFTAGVTAPATFYGRCLLISGDGDGTNQCIISASFSTLQSIIYGRIEFIVYSSFATQCPQFSLINYVGTSSSGIMFSNLNWDNTATNLRLLNYVYASTTLTLANVTNITPNVTYNLEHFWDITNEDHEVRLNGSTLYTLVITAVAGTTRQVRGIHVGNNSQTARMTLAIDNIRINNSNGILNNSWPGTSYDEPLRCVELLSTQRQIGLEL